VKIRTSRKLAFVVIWLCATGTAHSLEAFTRAGAQNCTRGNEPPVFSQTGLASWYSPRAMGARTASGERTLDRALTAAHRTLPFGSVVRVTNLSNCREVTVVVNDRGPYARGHRGRILDLSRRAALALGMKKQGVIPVRLEAHSSDQPGRPQQTAVQ